MRRKRSPSVVSRKTKSGIFFPALKLFVKQSGLLRYWHERNLPRYSKNYLQLFGITVGATFLTIGFILGGYNLYRTIVHALEESTVSMPTEVAFNRGTVGGLAGHDDGDGTVAVLSTEIRIATSSSWYDANFRYKIPVTLKNLSGTAAVTATASAQVTLDTASLVAAGKLQPDCDDLRVAYAATGSGVPRSGLPRTYQLAPGATDCSDSSLTIISFPIQSTLWSDGGTDPGYELYYGNPDITASAGGDNGYDILRADGSVASADLACPFNGTASCADNEAPAISGAVRYSGGKSALNFDGYNDQVDLGSPASMDDMGPLTWEAWIYPKTSNGDPNIIGKNRTRFKLDGNYTIEFEKDFSTVDLNRESVPNAVVPNQWQHVALTWDGTANYSGVHIFVNGQEVAYQANANGQGTAFSDASDNMFVGTHVSGGSFRFEGYIDEVRISNSVRYAGPFTPSSVPFGSDENTLTLLHFDENGEDPRNAGKALDASDNWNHGTITGAKYVSGFIGIDYSADHTGALGIQPYAGHQGVFIEEATANLVPNPSFENASATLNWSLPYFNYATASATFTAAAAKRNSAGPFAAGVAMQGNPDSTGTGDTLIAGNGSQIAGTFYQGMDEEQGSVVFWVTPEWNGNDGKKHVLAHLDQWSANISAIYKGTDNRLYLDFGTSNTVSQDVSSWTAGTTYLVTVRWDRDNPIEGTDNFMSLSINDTHVIDSTSPSFMNSYAMRGQKCIGADCPDSAFPANAIIEGFTVYRRPLFDGANGIDVGNGDEINLIYNGGAGRDPAAVTGSWDVVFALPTDPQTRSLSSGSGNAWTHPHASNLLGGTNGRDGFLLSGNYQTDGWTAAGLINTVDTSGGSMDFEADAGEYLTVPDSQTLSVTGDLTIGAWIKPERVTGNTQFTIAGKWDGAQTSYLLAQYGDEIRLYIGSPSVYVQSTNINLVPGQWYYVSAVYTAASRNVDIFLNGYEVGVAVNGTVPASIEDNGGRFTIGGEVGLESETLTYSIMSGPDDGYYNYNSAYSWYDNTGQSLGLYYLPAYGIANENWMRFQSVQIPQGATVTGAKFSYTGNGSAQNTTINSSIRMADVDDAVAPVSQADAQALAKTTAATQWDTTLTIAQDTPYYDSPDFAPAVQEVVDRPGWQAGNDMMVMFRRDDLSAGYMNYNAYERGQAYRPTFTVTYQTASSTLQNFYDGLIDDVKVYNRALNYQEIRDTIFKQSPASFELSGMEAWWKFEDGSGQTASDATGNNNTATLGVSGQAEESDPSWNATAPRPDVGNMPVSEKIYGGGYGVNGHYLSSIYQDIPVTPGQDLVIRAVAHSDGSCIPLLVGYGTTLWDSDGHAVGTATSTREDPDVLMYSYEVPPGETNLRLALGNYAMTPGVCYWHEVEVLPNLINNPSFQYVTGTPNPWIPTGWANDEMESGDAALTTSQSRTGNAISFVNLENGEGIAQNDSPVSDDTFYALGSWFREVSSTNVNMGFTMVSTTTLWNQHAYDSSGNHYHMAAHTSGANTWTHYKYIGRGMQNGTFSNNYSATGYTGESYRMSGYLDDLYRFALTGVDLTVTPASTQNSTESSGLRVDGADTLTQAVTGLTTTSGAIKFKFTPRHDYGVANQFGSTNPQIINLWADTSNYIYLNFTTASILRMRARFNGTSITADWQNPVLDAGTTYNFEISYNAGGNITLKVNDIERTTNTGVVPFSVVPTTAYFGSNVSGDSQWDGAYTSFKSMAVTENAGTQYLKFGGRSVRLSAFDKTDQYVTPVTLPVNGPYTVSAYVYNASSGMGAGTVDATVATLASGSASLATTYTDMGGGWWRLTNSSGVQPAGSYAYGVEVKNGKAAYVDGVQVEQKSYPTTYADGGMGTGYTWSGTANNSTSIRSATTIQYPLSGNVSLGAGTVSFWMKPTAGFFNHSGSNNSTMKLIDFGSSYFGSDGGFALAHYNSNIDLNAQAFGGTGSVMRSLTPDEDKWLHIVAVWNGSQGTLYVNNDAVTGSFAPHNFATNVIGVGDGYEIISDLRIFNASLSPDEVAGLYHQGLLVHQSGSETDDRYAAGAQTYTSPVIDLSAAGQWGATPLRFTHTLNGGSISYFTRTSADNSEWTEWAAVTGNEIASSPLRYFQWKAEMAANAALSESPVVNGMTVSYIEDSTVPENPGTQAEGFTDEASASATLVSGGWYNHAAPKFTWAAGVDAAGEGQSASGIASYLVLLTDDEEATPSANIADDCYLESDAGNRQFTVGASPASCSLSNGTYYLRLQTKDNSGNMADPVTLFVYKYDSTIPDAPASVSSTNVGYQATNSFTFYWPAAQDNGPAGVKGYEYKTGTSSGALSGWTFTAQTLATDVTAYQEGQNYFYVRTVDNAGNYSGLASNNISVTSFYYNATAPTEPRNITISPSTTANSPAASNVFTVEWDKPATYSGEIAKYYYCVNCTPSVNTMTETTAAETVNRKLENMALATQQGKNTIYILAEDNNVNTETGYGNRNYEAYATADFYASTVAPGAPQSLTVSDTSDRDSSMWRLTLAWKQPSSGGTPANYEVFRSTDNASFTSMGKTTSPAYTDADLTQSLTYYYKVKAIDNAGSSSIYSNTVSKAPEGRYSSPPTAGGAPSVSAGSTTATVTWTTSRTAFGTVEYGKASAYGYAGSETTATKTHSVKLTGLAPDTTYHYRVLSMDESEMVGYERVDAYSSDYSFTTLKAPSISEVKVSDVTLTSAIVTWKMSAMTTTKVEYGETTNYDKKVENLVIASESSHLVKLTSLKHSTAYHFRVRGTDSDQNDIVSDDYMFTTMLYPKVTAVVFNTDETEGGTSVVIAWSTNTETTGEIEYQAVDVDPASGRKYAREDLQKMSGTELSRLPVIPKGKTQYVYTGLLEKKHLARIPSLSDGSLYVFTVRGRDGHGNEAVSEPIRYMTGIDTRAPTLQNVIIETPVTGIGADAKAQIIVSWDTDEPAFGQVVWGAGTGSEYPQATERDQSLTGKHVMVIRDLNPTSSYHLKIISTDKASNRIESNDTVVVTPSAQAAAFDVIIRNLEDVFGFLKL